MAFAKTEVYEMDRRALLKFTGTMGIAVGFMPSELYAGGACEKLVTSNGGFKATQAGATLQFWIDGLHFGDRTNVKSRANVTLFMDLSQTAVSYVESVVLMDPNKKLLGARYFDSSMKMLDGHVPYVRFENVELDSTKDYYCVYSVRSGSTVKLYTAKIEKPETSKLNTTWLPQQMRNDFKTFLVGNTANPTPGLITTQFQFYTVNGLATHTARGRVKEMSSDGKSFKVNIDFMHADANDQHFMRYFIVMDPVGRLLGVVKRTKKGDPTGVVGGSTVDVTPITQQQKDDLGIPDLQVGNIADCPYIQFYTEDSYDAIARNMIRLR
jgi:hypothetical protein